MLTSVSHLLKKAELKAVGLRGKDLEWGRGKCASLHMGRGGQRLRWIGGGFGFFSRYYNITHISLRACMHCMY